MAFRSPNPGYLPYLRGFAKYWSSLFDMRLSTSGRKYQSPITAFALQRNQHTVRRTTMSPWDRSSWLASELSGRPPSYCAILKAEASTADITRLESRIQHQWAIFKPNTTSKPENEDQNTGTEDSAKGSATESQNVESPDSTIEARREENNFVCALSPSK